MTVENITVLFTDMVGSTELSSSLSAEVADELRRSHFSILRQAIAAAGGTEVKNLGDGLMVAFGSASAALSAAVAMQQGVERDNRDREQAVGLRVGLSGGEVSKEDDDYFGDPVVEAARLCATCESGQVLAADVVRLMAGRRSQHEYNPLGPLALKGLPEPVDTVEVRWEPLDSATANAVPLPGGLGALPRVGVVGRSVELATMTDATKRVAAGEGREVVLVSGEAGQGKTTLVAAAARTAFDSGACVLFGHCEEDLATPYQLFAEALGHYVTHAPEDELLAHVSEHGSELALLVPALGSRLPGLSVSKAADADTERYLLFAAIVGLLAMASRRQLVVVVLDDLQWADTGSLQLLRHLVASDLPRQLLVLGTFRDSELSRSHPLLETLAALRRREGVSRVELAGLDDTSVVAFMEQAAGHDLDDAAVALAQAVYRETDGNPFFVTEVLRHLTETGAIYQDPTGRWVAAESLDQSTLPDSVREVIGARVGRLGEPAGRVLSAAAVIGRDFDLDLLARTTDTTEDELLDVLDAAATAALVREVANAPGRYSFAHALIQHTLYEDLGATRRARAHRHVAEALETLCDGRPGARVGELARHWFHATQPIDLAKAVGYSRQAADAALGALAPDDALRYYTQALDLLDQADDADPILALDLAIGLGTAQRQTANPDYSGTLIDAARRAAELGDTPRLVRAALANNPDIVIAQNPAIDTDWVEILELALTRLPAGDPDRALVLANLCHEIAFGTPLERRETLAAEAIAIAQASGDDATIVWVLNKVAIALGVPQRLEQSLASSSDALARAERLGNPVLLFWAAFARWFDLGRAARDVDEMDRCLQITRSMAEQLHQPTLDWTSRGLDVARAILAGDTDRAERLAGEAFQVGQDIGLPGVFAPFGVQTVLLSAQRGTYAELVPVFEKALAGTPVLRPALAIAYAEADRVQDARHLIAEFADEDFDLPIDEDWLIGMAGYAEAAITCGASEFAEPLLDRIAPFADQAVWDEGVPAGPVGSYLGGLAGLLGRYDEADIYFLQASAMSERLGAKFFGARSELWWGLMLVERNAAGDVERARSLLTKAHAAASAHGYAGLERRATRALQQLD